MLNIVNKSPLDRGSLDSCLQAADGGAILLIEDGVYAATKGSAGEAKLKAAGSKFKLYALGADAEARGIADRMMDGITLVDYEGFVDLVAEHNTCQSWL
ncbi:MAG: sulfurtransferase complex subunit TusB [Gammaproteobacteria bacterium]|nr:sulfurtransferase complex subunit TusB [Gammaproteobacteria bacterium]MBU1415373.1 sulfurtransferase complex subunit TusB [Gammaproteobacteria bacterium]